MLKGRGTLTSQKKGHDEKARNVDVEDNAEKCVSYIEKKKQHINNSPEPEDQVSDW
jgi:hypothetical protein